MVLLFTNQEWYLEADFSVAKSIVQKSVKGQQKRSNFSTYYYLLVQFALGVVFLLVIGTS